MSHGNEIHEYEGPGGEMMSVQEVPLDSLGTLTRAEIDSQIATAKRYPRSIAKFMADMKSIATLDEEVAASCCYALPRGGKAIEGPSVRLAEIAAHCFGNIRVAGRITQETGNFIVAQCTGIDLEKNSGVQIEVRRRITDRQGRRFQDDMITVTANAALSIAYRNTVFKVVPSAFIQPIYRLCKRTAGGDEKTIEARRKGVAEWLRGIGVKPAEMFVVLGVKGWEDIGLEQMATLAGFITALKEGETTVDEVFRPTHAKPENALPAPSKADQMASDLQAKMPAAAPQPEPAAAVAEPADKPRKGKLFPES
jgi:hypothetical protein